MPEQEGPLFSATVARRVRVVLILGVLVLLSLPAAAMLWVRSPVATGAGREVVQPIPFDHRHHVHDAGISCAFCHRHADGQAHAGMPDTRLCMRCHNQVLTEAAVLEPLRRAHEAGEQVHWRRVNRLPDFVFFHHGVHVAAQIDCSRCHGAVEDMASVRQARPMTMGWCLDCHRHPDLDPAAMPADPGPEHCSACHR